MIPKARRIEQARATNGRIRMNFRSCKIIYMQQFCLLVKYLQHSLVPITAKVIIPIGNATTGQISIKIAAKKILIMGGIL